MVCGFRYLKYTYPWLTEETNEKQIPKGVNAVWYLISINALQELNSITLNSVVMKLLACLRVCLSFLTPCHEQCRECLHCKALSLNCLVQMPLVRKAKHSGASIFLANTEMHRGFL